MEHNLWKECISKRKIHVLIHCNRLIKVIHQLKFVRGFKKPLTLFLHNVIDYKHACNRLHYSLFDGDRLKTSITNLENQCNRLHDYVIDYSAHNFAQNLFFASCNRLQHSVIDYNMRNGTNGYFWTDTTLGKNF